MGDLGPHPSSQGGAGRWRWGSLNGPCSWEGLAASCTPTPLTLPSLSPLAEPHSLLHLSRRRVRHTLGHARLGQVAALPLPPAMKRYLLYQ